MAGCLRENGSPAAPGDRRCLAASGCLLLILVAAGPVAADQGSVQGGAAQKKAAAPQPRAKWPRLHLERVDTSRCLWDQLVTAQVSHLELQGTLRAAPVDGYRLVLDGKVQEAAPVANTTFAGSGAPLQLAVLVQTNATFTEEMPRIRNGVRTLVRQLPRGSRATLVSFDSRVTPLCSYVDPQKALVEVSRLKPSLDRDLPALTDALKVTLRRLTVNEAPERRILVVVSDGLSVSLKRDLFRTLGDEAYQEGIPIHPVGYSPTDDRGPLLNLGELAKRSVGMFRWARKAEDIEGQFDNVAREIYQQLLVSFAMPDSCLAGYGVQVRWGDSTSGTRKLQAVARPEGTWPRWRLALRRELGPQWQRVLGVAGGAVLVLLAGVPLAVLLALRRGRRARVPADPPAPDEPSQPRRKRKPALPAPAAKPEPLPEAPAPKQPTVQSDPLRRTGPPPTDPPPARPVQQRDMTRTGPPVLDPWRPQPPPPAVPVAGSTPGYWPPRSAPPAEPRFSLVRLAPTGPASPVVVQPGSYRVGTAPDCLICLEGGAGVSTYHAELRCGGGTLAVVDLDSRGGTFVNGQRVRQAALKEGDVLQVGTVPLRVTTSPSPWP